MWDCEKVSQGVHKQFPQDNKKVAHICKDVIDFVEGGIGCNRHSTPRPIFVLFFQLKREKFCFLDTNFVSSFLYFFCSYVNPELPHLYHFIQFSNVNTNPFTHFPFIVDYSSYFSKNKRQIILLSKRFLSSFGVMVTL